jgi:plastocyanin
MLGTLLQDLRHPEYIHVLLNPLPVYGLVVGLVGLGVAIWQGSRSARAVALLLIIISTTAAWPVYEYGEQAYDRVLSMADDPGQAWLAVHKERAENLIWFFYALAILSVLALIVSWMWPRTSLLLSIMVFALGAVTLGIGGYISYAGGRVRHREFRNEPPPATLRKSAAPAAPAHSPPSASVAPVATSVKIRMLKYSSETIQIKAGETVEWVNDDLTPHTVTSQSGEFDSGSIDAGETWRHTFTQPGTFPYFCTFHKEMTGTVVVK